MAPIQRTRSAVDPADADLDGAEHGAAGQPAERRRRRRVDVAGHGASGHAGQREARRRSPAIGPTASISNLSSAHLCLPLGSCEPVLPAGRWCGAVMTRR